VIARITDYGIRITNWPNPFIESTTFSYTLKESSQVTLQIFNSFGQLVAEPVNKIQIKGEEHVKWDAGNLPAGMYYYRIHAGKQVGSGKIIKW
jgi:flagellar hook assembly protein FlgD